MRSFPNPTTGAANVSAGQPFSVEGRIFLEIPKRAEGIMLIYPEPTVEQISLAKATQPDYFDRYPWMRDVMDRPEAVNGENLIIAERDRQITVLGFTFLRDDEYTQQELLRAANCYLVGNTFRHDHTHNWPWPMDWWRPSTRVRNLTKAGALLLAESERLARAGRAGGATMMRLKADEVAGLIDVELCRESPVPELYDLCHPVNGCESGTMMTGAQAESHNNRLKALNDLARWKCRRLHTPQ